MNGFIEPGDRINVIVTLTAPIEALAEEVISSGEELTPEELAAIEEQIEEDLITRFVMQGLPILAVGREIRAEEEAEESVTVTTAPGEEEAAQASGAGVLTLEVTPEQAERIVHVFSSGSVWLTLVPEDFVPVPTEGITRDTLFGEQEELSGR